MRSQKTPGIPRGNCAQFTLPSKKTAGSKLITSSPTPASNRTARGRSLTLPGTLSSARVLVESMSLSMCLMILLGWFPFERISSKSASLVKWKRGKRRFFPLRKKVAKVGGHDVIRVHFETTPNHAPGFKLTPTKTRSHWNSKAAS